MDFFNILKTTHKLKAGLSAIIGNQQSLNKHSREFYMNQTTVFENLELEKKYFIHNKFSNFLAHTDRQTTHENSIKVDLGNAIQKAMSQALSSKSDP